VDGASAAFCLEGSLFRQALVGYIADSALRPRGFEPLTLIH